MLSISWTKAVFLKTIFLIWINLESGLEPKSQRIKTMNIVEKRSTIHMFFPCTGGGSGAYMHTCMHILYVFLFIFMCIFCIYGFFCTKVDCIPYVFSFLGWCESQKGCFFRCLNWLPTISSPPTCIEEITLGTPLSPELNIKGVFYVSTTGSLVNKVGGLPFVLHPLWTRFLLECTQPTHHHWLHEQWS